MLIRMKVSRLFLPTTLSQFSKKRVEVLFLRDTQFGFEGQIVKVKPGFYDQVLHPKGYAVMNTPGFQERLLPELDQDLLSQKIKRQKIVRDTMDRISSLYLEFIRPATFANPNVVKQPVTDQEIINELKARFGFIIQPSDLNLTKKVNTFGHTTLNIQNYWSDDLGRSINFPIRIMIKRQVIRQGKNDSAPQVNSKEETPKDGVAQTAAENQAAPQN